MLYVACCVIYVTCYRLYAACRLIQVACSIRQYVRFCTMLGPHAHRHKQAHTHRHQHRTHTLYSRSTSLSAWAKVQNFPKAVAEENRLGKLDAAGIDCLKQIRASACGESGSLSKAQRRNVKPEEYTVSGGKPVVPKVSQQSPGTTAQKRKVIVDGGGNVAKVASLEKQIKDLKLLVGRGQPSVAPKAPRSRRNDRPRTRFRPHLANLATFADLRTTSRQIVRLRRTFANWSLGSPYSKASTASCPSRSRTLR